MTIEKEALQSPEISPTPSPNVALFDHDAIRFIDKLPGHNVDMTSLGTFIREHDVHDRVGDEMALRFYRPDGRLAQENSEVASWSVVGHTSPGIIVRRQGGHDIPAPIGVQYGPHIKEGDINFNLRHELYHLLYGNLDRDPIDKREKVRTATRLGALATSLTSASSIPELFNKTWLYHESVIEKTSPFVTVGTFLGLSIAALYSAAVATRSRNFLRRFDKEEYRADAFAKRYKEFNPITYVKDPQ